MFSNIYVSPSNFSPLLHRFSIPAVYPCGPLSCIHLT